MRNTFLLLITVVLFTACWRNQGQDGYKSDYSDSLAGTFGDSSEYPNDENYPDTSDQNFQPGNQGQNSSSNIAQLRQTPEFHYKRAHVLYKIKNYAEGVKEFDTVIQLEPNLADAFKYRGDGYMQLGRYDAAIPDFEKAINTDRTDTASYVQLALCWYNLGNFEKCIGVNSEIIELNPNRSKSYFNRGVVYGQIKDFDKAIEDFDKAIQLDTKNGEAYFNRGLAFYKTGSLKNACSDWQKAKNFGHAKAERVLQQYCK